MNKFICVLAASALCSISASAQSTGATTQVTPGATAPAATSAKIGPPPANSHQSKVLASALSPETRKTLADAMNAIPDVPAKPAAHAK